MIYLVDLEYVETRYTAQWKTEFPKLLESEGWEVTVIEGPDNIADCATPGAFLNFSGTNIYKAEQVKRIAELFTDNKVKDDDQFIFADAWHPGVINLKYMAELLGVDIKIHGLWHAGSYDENDFLGRHIGDAKWVRHAEASFYNCYDYNWFASQYHRSLFEGNFGTNEKSFLTGWPMHYLSDVVKPGKKENLILFPHRMAPEKQPEIFEHLATQLPEYDFVICQKLNLNKNEYHELLGKAKIVFSANLQETLGIGCYEALCAGAVPLVPNRLSYEEMYTGISIYPSYWSSSMQNFLRGQKDVVARIKDVMENFEAEKIQKHIHTNRQFLELNYFSAGNLLKKMKGDNVVFLN